MDNFYTVDMLNNEAERAINRHDSAVDLNNPARTGQNGRLFIPEGELGAPRYNLFQNQNQAHDLDAKIISHNHVPTDLGKAYFSTNNLNNVQNLIIGEVSRRSNGQYKIGRQNDNELQVIMSSMYYQYAKNLKNNIVQQVNDLNNLVVEECVRIIIPNIQQHLGYIRDITSGIPILPRPQNVSNAGRNTFSLLLV